MGKMPKGWIRLAGGIWLNLTSGSVQERYPQTAPHGFKVTVMNVKGKKGFRLVKETYGTSKGKSTRERLARAIMNRMKKRRK